MPVPNLPFYSQLPSTNMITVEADRSIEVNRGYLRLVFTDMRLARDTVGTKRLVPALHLIASREGDGSDLFEKVVSPSRSGESSSDMRYTYIAPTVLTPTIPFNGNSLDVELGLFSIPFQDLCKELLELLSILVSPMPYPQLTVAVGLADALRRAVDNLFGLNGARLLLAWKGSLAEQETLKQQYFILTAPRTALPTKELKIVSGKLMHQGSAPQHENYLVFAVQVSDRREDWSSLPEIRPHFIAWNSARSTYGIASDVYNNYVTELLKALRTSPNIVSRDAERIAQEEVLPLLTAGASVQAALFRAAGFRLDPNSSSSTFKESVGEFADVDVVVGK